MKTLHGKSLRLKRFGPLIVHVIAYGEKKTDIREGYFPRKTGNLHAMIPPNSRAPEMANWTASVISTHIIVPAEFAISLWGLCNP